MQLETPSSTQSYRIWKKAEAEEMAEFEEADALDMQHGMWKRCSGFALLPRVRRCYAPVEGTPRLTQGVEQATDVQMVDVQVADVQSGLHPLSESVAFRAALQVVPTAFPAIVAAPMEVEEWTAD